MKICNTCGQAVSEQISICPACGNHLRSAVRQIDSYRVKEIIHEGSATILYKAIDDEEKPVMLRLFTADSGVGGPVALRLKSELLELKKLPLKGFVKHQEIKQSRNGLWYRISEWVEAISWGDLMVSGELKDFASAFGLFHKIASYLSILHDHGHTIPHLILNDIMVVRNDAGELDVKIDYKLSRFLDPDLAKPGPMLKTLIKKHPDLKSHRPLNYKSDIWSLGKLFVEILTADYYIKSYSKKIDRLPLPHEIKVFLKSLLAEDPDMRPGSIREIVRKLEEFKKYDFDDFARSCGWHQPSPSPPPRKKRRRYVLTSLSLFAVVISISAFFLMMTKFRNGDDQSRLFFYANKYANALAFVTVSYWVESDNEVLYQNHTEGTAFLVDNAGYLLTNRHVACPWLEDQSLMYVITRLKESDIPLAFEYRIYLWFEGQKAFYQSLEQKAHDDPMEKYFLQSAYRSNGQPGVSIAGVARVPDKTGYVINSPLKDDFAVLKVDQVPPNMIPLPLDEKMNPGKISRLYPVITLGFPLGSQTQAGRVNVSVTRGHVRRSFESMIQVDTSIHKGNSGGPIIDARGMVIGIASGVATMRAPGPVPITTPLSDIGMVLPIGQAISFLNQLKKGAIKWNGDLDMDLDGKLGRINRLALDNEWETARDLSEEILSNSVQPALFLISAMMHYCTDEYNVSRERFNQVLSMDEENALPMFMLYLLDWVEENEKKSPYRDHLLSLTWRSRSEFLGYLVKILSGQIDEEEALQGWDTLAEKSWIDFISGLIYFRNGELDKAEAMIEKACMNAAIDDWCILLARARLTAMQRQHMARIKSIDLRDKYFSQILFFQNKLDEEYKRKERLKDETNLKLAHISRGDTDPEIKLAILMEIMESDSQDGTVRANLAFYHAMHNDWSGALEQARIFLKKKGRESASRLSLGLLEAEILNKLGKKGDADAALAAFQERTRDKWYNNISKSLSEDRIRKKVESAASDNPENMLTAHMALGLWAEGSNASTLALRHYKAALESYLDEWMEYDFARERIKALKLDTAGRPRKRNHISDIGDASQQH